jgi:hypothetical protein
MNFRILGMVGVFFILVGSTLETRGFLRAELLANRWL